MATNPNVERGLHASVKVFNFAKVGIESGAETVHVTREELVELKKAALAMNRSITRFAKEAFAAENRLLLEVHMLRGIMKRENTDRDANRARVYEFFRKYHGDNDNDDGVLASAGASSSSAGGNPLNARSAAAVAVDRAISSLDRLDQSVRDLAPVGRLNTHGAGLLQAKALRDAKLASRQQSGPASDATTSAGP